MRDDSFLLLFNAHHEEITFRLPARRFGTRWEVELATGRRRRRRGSTPGADVAVESRSIACSSGVAEFRADLPAAADARLRLRGRRASSSRTCATSASRTSTSRRRCRRAPARSTATTSSTRATSRRELGGEEEFRKLATSGLGVILDIVPNHMAAVDESPFWRDERLREMFFDVDLRTGFHRRFFDIGELGGVKQEDWEVFWATHAKVIELVRDGPRRRRARRPSRRARRSRPSTSSGSREAGVEHVWAEKIVEPGEELRDWPIEGTTGYEFLNDVMALFVDDSRGAGVHRALRGADRRHAPLRGHRGARRSSRSRSTSSSPSCAGCTRRSRSTTCRSRSRRSTSTAPTSGRTTASSTTPTARRSAAPTSPRSCGASSSCRSPATRSSSSASSRRPAR